MKILMDFFEFARLFLSEVQLLILLFSMDHRLQFKRTSSCEFIDEAIR